MTAAAASSSSSSADPADTMLSHPDIEADYLPFDAAASCWADVAPVFQDDGPADVLCGIMYDTAYSSAMDLFRALYPQREISPRALALTTHLVSLNPSMYSIWAYRADILISSSTLSSSSSSSLLPSLGDRATRLRRELQWMEDLARGNMKSYQVWQHRRLILCAIESPSREVLEAELDFIGSVLSRDSKNYHTWAYRQWVLAHFAGMPQEEEETSASAGSAGKLPELWQAELPYTDKLLAQDARNNSAWNHRFFIIFGSRRGAVFGPEAIGLQLAMESRTNGWTSGDTASAGKEEENLRQCIESEVNYIKRSLSLIPNNASSWTYLRGILSLSSRPLPLSSYSLPKWIKTNLLSPFLLDAATPLPAAGESGSSSTVCVFALEYLLDVLQEESEGGARGQTSGTGSRPECAGAQEEQVERLIFLLKREDPVRAQWWEVRRREVLSVLKLGWS
ncbi:protein prenylyltransferase [Microstroma glucosiphilum]|uniref:Protein farnesyltransferase/geranylgeranyltransferase type-1 subunit alpha n=1 Tax=Pseudomicrostroma glucosiphilum TaxID=1684307 RepID=A0A316TXA2_9BASI|nr:protein prenylyltransferase [Pseudomicrostroma glucosiphilum]PWN17790.1 protein prenylyltransferase [Pseudomicrostroma glucosiphilum]